jgi:hypothetical protein
MPYRHRRRVRNFVLALLLLGAAAWIVPSYFSAERYRRRLQTGLEQALHRPVKFGAVTFQLLPRPGFSIVNAEVAEDPDFGLEPFARVDRIDCALRWRSLWRSRVDCVHLRLENPSFNIVLNPRGEWNVERLLLQSGVTAPAAVATGTPAPAEQLDLDVDDARVNFLVGADKKPFALTDVRGRLQINPAQRRVQFAITASPVRSDLAVPTPGPVEFRGTWEPGADLHGPLEAWLSARGALLYDWVPVVTGKNPQVYGVIDAQDVHLSGSLPDLTLAGESHLTQLQRWEDPSASRPMASNVRFRLRLMRERQHLLVENLEVFFADSHLRVSGSVEKLWSAPQLDLVVALDHSRLEDLLAIERRIWPSAASWNLKGKVDALLAVQGPWEARRYGGYAGAQEVSLETPAGAFAVSEVAVRINHHGAVLAPVQVVLAPHVALTVTGAIDRTGARPRYEVQVTAKGIPLHDAVSFGRALGVRELQGIDASGSATGVLRLAASAWPLAPPVPVARLDVRAARLLLPGLTEPLNLPHASVQVAGDQIVADPVVAVLGTSVFKGRLWHRGERAKPWMFDLAANSLSLEQGARWFDALGLRRAPPWLERLPGISSFAARRVAAAQIFGSLNAHGQFATPTLHYRDVTLKDFQGTFEVTGRTVRMSSARFRAAEGHGQAEGTADFTVWPPALAAKVSLTGVSIQPMMARLPGPAHEVRGRLDATGALQTHGLAREELAQNLAGKLELRIRDLSFGDFDPLGTLAQQMHWGKLEPVRTPVVAAPVNVDLEIRNRRALVKSAALDLSGAQLRCSGAYTWPAALNLDVRANLRHLRRRWLVRGEGAAAPSEEMRWAGPIDHLVVTPQESASPSGRSRRGAGVR